jgi:hypothetical protein
VSDSIFIAQKKQEKRRGEERRGEKRREEKRREEAWQEWEDRCRKTGIQW